MQKCGSLNLLMFVHTVQPREHPGGLARDRRVISASGEQLCPLPSGSAGKTLKDPFRLGLQPSPKQDCVESMGTAFGNALH